MQDIIGDTCRWFVTAKQQPEAPTPSIRQMGFYIGMQMEELCEKLEALFGLAPDFIQNMRAVAQDFKLGLVDAVLTSKLDENPAIYKDLLDADMDLIWVTIGAARAQGADVAFAYEKVSLANHAKFVNGVANLAPDTGRVLKPEGWKAPDLTGALHFSLQNHATIESSDC